MLPKGGLIRSAREKYHAWANARSEPESGLPEAFVEPVVESRAVYEQALETSRAEIEQHIDNLSPYEFQDLVGELLRAMGYNVRSVAEPGPDGGVDVVAYGDPLGTVAPRIKVQVKHRQQKVAANEVRELQGLLRRDGEIGLIVSSGGFSADALRELRASAKHIETMDLDRLVTLWQEHYPRVSESGRKLLPLVAIYFLDLGDASR